MKSKLDTWIAAAIMSWITGFTAGVMNWNKLKGLTILAVLSALLYFCHVLRNRVPSSGLRPCPFCGVTPVLQTSDIAGDDWCNVMCCNPKCRVGVEVLNRENRPRVMQAWNDRKG